MNSWGEDPNELLRQRWQQTFADFEVQSRTSVRRRILSRVPIRNRPKLSGWLMGGVLLLLLSTFLFYMIHYSNRPALTQGRMANVQPAPPTSSERFTISQPMTPSRPATSSKPSEIGPRINRAMTEQMRNRQPSVAYTKPMTREGSPRRHTQPTNQLRLRTKLSQPQAEPYRASQTFVKSPRFTAQHFSSTLSPAVDTSDRRWAQGLVEHTGNTISDTNLVNYVLSNQRTIPASTLLLARLKTPALSALPTSLRALPDRLPIKEVGIGSSVEAVNRVGLRKQWFIETVPLSSFQWMSTSSTSTAYLTRVNAPAAFSPATWGYQINGGIRWQRWQAYLSIGQLRRWAYYTVNENRYRMEPSSTNSYQMVREKHVVAENVALSMVGGGLSQYRLLGRGRYMVDLGSQVAYSPSSGQLLASLRTGAGRRLAVSREFELQAGLMAEYGLTRLTSERQELIIHPIVVGVSIRIQPRLYSQAR